MDHTYWHKQTAAAPLYPDLLWSRPENKAYAGKLLIIGGNAFGFAAPAEAYAASLKAGVGLTRVVLPLRVKALMGKVLESVEFAMSNPSGGFSQLALGELLAQAEWANGVLLAGDFGRNSETAILLEKFLTHWTGQITITKDAVDYFVANPTLLLLRPNTTLVLSFAQLQKLAIGAKFTTAFTFTMGFFQLIEALHELTLLHKMFIVTKQHDTIFVAVNGQVSTTKLTPDIDVWRVRTASTTAVWWLQNPSKSFEALTTAVQPQ